MRTRNDFFLETLEEEIRLARNRMLELWNVRGCTDSEVLDASVELDCLINEYQRITGFSKRE